VPKKIEKIFIKKPRHGKDEEATTLWVGHCYEGVID